jgi:hypothetical protein
MAHGKKGYKRYRPDLLLRLEEKILCHYPKSIIDPLDLAKEIQEPVHQVIECLDEICKLGAKEAEEEKKRRYSSYVSERRIRVYPIGNKYRITGNFPRFESKEKKKKPSTKCKLCGADIKRTHGKSKFHSKHKCNDKIIEDIIEG